MPQEKVLHPVGPRPARGGTAGHTDTPGGLAGLRPDGGERGHHVVPGLGWCREINTGRADGLGIVVDQALDRRLDEDPHQVPVRGAELDPVGAVLAVHRVHVDGAVERDHRVGLGKLRHLSGSRQPREVRRVARLDTGGQQGVDVASSLVADLVPGPIRPRLDHCHEGSLLAAAPGTDDMKGFTARAAGARSAGRQH